MFKFQSILPEVQYVQILKWQLITEEPANTAEGTLTLTRSFIWTLSPVVVLGSLSQLLSKEQETQLLPTKVHVSSDTLAQLCSMTQSPVFWGALICAPELGTGTAAGNAIEAPNLLNSRHQGTVRTLQVPVPQVGHRQCLSLQLNKFYPDLSLLDSATAFPIYHSFHSSGTKKSSHTSQKN